MAIRIGFVGAGRAAQKHWHALAQWNVAANGITNQIVAVCDADAKSAQLAARRLGATAYPNARQMLAVGGLDAVYICLPANAHRDAEIIAAQSGCALFIEPPIAPSVEVARRIMRVLDDTKVLCTVGFPMRYRPSFERVQKLCGSRAAASQSPLLLQAHARVLVPRLTSPRFASEASAPSHLFLAALPLFDAMRAVGREVQSVSTLRAQWEKLLDPGAKSRRVAAHDATESFAVSLQFRGGAVGQIAFSFPPRAAYTRTATAREDTEMVVRCFARESQIEWSARGLSVRRGEESQIWRDEAGDDGILRLNGAFLEAVATGKRNHLRASYRDAAKTLKVALAAAQSLHSGKTVRLNEK